ncbi:LamG domain-containing protein [Desulfosediminicola flagellatus]|uniref:LamG domain-containing protein n=1 Tax=Desulfosediminicola flagellatus TaxID=2569541 RepID=UPI00142EA016|nr:LamG domain-containing protein [Desulfosediminicola flagellatus]
MKKATTIIWKILFLSIFITLQLTATLNAQSDDYVVLWNKLGSEDEILNSEIGPNLEFYDQDLHDPPGCCDVEGGRLYDFGVFGNGVMLSGGPYYVTARIHNLVLSNLSSYVSSEQGTIAVWYMQKNDPVSYVNNVYRIFDGDFGLGAGMQFQSVEDGGLVFSLAFGGETSSVNTDISTFNNTWIHIAAVWDRNGIAGTPEALRLYVDGVKVASTTQNNWGTSVGDMADICGSNDDDENFAMDNLVIYDFAKTDFSDRFSENPLTSVSRKYQDATSIADLDGNGFPEIAVLHTRNGHTYVTLKDSYNKTQVGRIYFFNDKWTPKAISTLADMNGNGTDELAVLAVKKENGKVWVKILDSETREVLNSVYFLDNDWMAMGLTTVADLNQNGVDELAVLVVEKSTGRGNTIIRDAETREQLNWICY